MSRGRICNGQTHLMRRLDNMHHGTQWQTTSRICSSPTSFWKAVRAFAFPVFTRCSDGKCPNLPRSDYFILQKRETEVRSSSQRRLQQKILFVNIPILGSHPPCRAENNVFHSLKLTSTRRIRRRYTGRRNGSTGSWSTPSSHYRLSHPV